MDVLTLSTNNAVTPPTILTGYTMTAHKKL